MTKAFQLVVRINFYVWPFSPNHLIFSFLPSHFQMNMLVLFLSLAGRS